MEYMVVGALQEARVYGYERFHAFFCQTACKGYGVAF